jgi:glycosyltransferase A (GT-A) superfamily protein (DUF2064 family)
MFAFSLAERLGMTVKELLARMDSQELSEWLAFDKVYNRQGDYQTARICHAIYSIFAKRAGKLADHLPRRPARQMDDESIKGVLLKIPVPRPRGQ